MAAWVYQLPGAGDWAGIIGVGGSSQDGYNLELAGKNGGGGGGPYLNVNLNFVASTGSVVIPYYTWTHVAVRRSGSTRLFINGRWTGDSLGNTPNPPGLGMQMGAESGQSTRWFRGNLAQGLVYNVALSDSQIFNLANLNVIPFTGLVTKWNLDEGSGTVANDTSGAGNTGTITNGVWVQNSLLTPFTSPNYGNVAVDDGDYFVQSGNTNVITLYQKIWTTNANYITVTWKGRTNLSPAIRPVLLQIYNYQTGLWETWQSQTVIPANTDFVMTATITQFLQNYYDSRNRVSARVYQQGV